MIQAKVPINVRYAETDQMGVVYHGNYLAWFEVARTQMFKDVGLPYKKIEADGYHLPVLEVSLKYHRPALYDDDLVVTAKLAEKPVLRIKVQYEVHRGDTLLVTGTTMHAFIDHEGRPVRPPPYVAEKMNEVFK
ncbi:acyl-CoA thioesterase [Ereboglobus luteus]|uniref:Acyl-CoA thioester hydrolase n=1 Tax=Ereboglobus luteus TaxID=1796921 RepID=A0A2U8E1V5_9BACT|nr:thioesterase family protein [Ereboglobus luteus]AWI08766.1 acyl-CoA thioester hydrolase [Ereboglobus luteus]